MKAPRFWFSPVPGPTATALLPASWLFRAGGALRRTLARPFRAAVPVICIGNATLGGAGKTPVALDIGRRLSAAGARPHFLTRGYGGTAPGPLLVDPERHGADMVGDEPLLLARIAPTWVAKDRAAGARAAAEAGASHIVMDDGFQNPSLHKDVSVLVFDARVGIGNGLVCPAGPLREPAARAAARADLLIVVGNGIGPLPDTAALPVLRARVAPIRPDSLPPGTACIAFAGIARPEKLFESLDELDLAVIHKAAYPDHHMYSKREIDDLRAAAAEAGAILVTTEKDWVRLAPDARADIVALPISLDWAGRADPLAHIAEALPA